jgi:Bacterial antitoxin of type II TA system, VapB
MRVNLEISDKKMKAIIRLTRQEKKETAVALALDDYLAFNRRQTFVNLVMAGKTDYQSTNEEIERSCSGIA